LPAEYFGSLYDSALNLESDPVKASAAVLKFLTVPAYSQNPRGTLEWSLPAFRAFIKARRALILESMSEVVNFELRK
jgi:hypothetical protein